MAAPEELDELELLLLDDELLELDELLDELLELEELLDELLEELLELEEEFVPVLALPPLEPPPQPTRRRQRSTDGQAARG